LQFQKIFCWDIYYVLIILETEQILSLFAEGE
jgi:hypothetical protein